MSSKALFCYLIALICLTFTQLVKSQESLGTISGTVTDPSGSPIPNVSITATQSGTNRESKTISNETGAYTIQALPVGAYQVRATTSGFKAAAFESVTVSTATTTNLDIALTVGDVSEVVTVTGEPLLQSTGAELSTVVERRVMLDLPLQLSGNAIAASGRRQANSFIFLTPGVTGNQFEKSFNGAPSLTSEIIIDGVSFQTAETPGAIGFTAPPYEAIEEFNVQNTLYPAEFGRGFGVTNFSLKSGTNDFHGDLFEFLRNDVVDARAFFAADKPPVRQNEFGGTLGRHVRVFVI